ncbi:MAG: VanW family protein [Lachnospiraceae bacterium]
MERLGKCLSKYLFMSMMTLMLVLFGGITVFASGDIGSDVEESTGAAETEEDVETAEMLAKLNNVRLEAEDTVYSGKEAKPSVKLLYTDEESGVTDEDVTMLFVFETSCSDIDAKKDAAVTAAVKGYYKKESGEEVLFDSEVQLTAGFEIKPRKIDSLKLNSTAYTYNGTAQKPVLTVKAGNVTLSSKDYSFTITDSKGKKDSSINVGTKTVTVKGKGNYTGTLAKTYTIKAKSISSASVTLTAKKYSYNGKDRKPGVTVKTKLSSGTVTLKKDRDYTVTYSSNCKSIGTKKVTIKGKGNYSGQTKTYTYTVVPEKASGLKVAERSSDSLKITCKKAKASGCKYQFILKKYDSSSKKWVNVSTKKTSSPSAVFSGLKSGTAYACYVRIYKTVSSTTYTGETSSVMKTATSPTRPVMSYAVKTGSSSMKAVWKAVSAATGYEVQYSTKSDFSSNVKTVTVKGRTTTSKKISGLNSSGTYYVRVRAYRTYNGKTYRSSWSSKVSTYYSNVYASYTTSYDSSNTNRSTNLRLACNAINGKILANGDTFSFNGVVGERTAAKGYKEAIIYEGGQEVGGIGGGICQVATTLFNAALKANFTIVERHQHSMTVHYCPLGYDAAIAWGSKNLRFRNNSGTSVMIDIHASGGTLSVRFLTNVYKKPPAVTTKVTVSNGVYTLRRYVNGKVNYTTTSDYLDN